MINENKLREAIGMSNKTMPLVIRTNDAEVHISYYNYKNEKVESTLPIEKRNALLSKVKQFLHKIVKDSKLDENLVVIGNISEATDRKIEQKINYANTLKKTNEDLAAILNTSDPEKFFLTKFNARGTVRLSYINNDGENKSYDFSGNLSDSYIKDILPPKQYTVKDIKYFQTEENEEKFVSEMRKMLTEKWGLLECKKLLDKIIEHTDFQKPVIVATIKDKENIYLAYHTKSGSEETVSLPLKVGEITNKLYEKSGIKFSPEFFVSEEVMDRVFQDRGKAKKVPNTNITTQQTITIEEEKDFKDFIGENSNLTLSGTYSRGKRLDGTPSELKIVLTEGKQDHHFTVMKLQEGQNIDDAKSTVQKNLRTFLSEEGVNINSSLDFEYRPDFNKGVNGGVRHAQSTVNQHYRG